MYVFGQVLAAAGLTDFTFFIDCLVYIISDSETLELTETGSLGADFLNSLLIFLCQILLKLSIIPDTL